MGKGRAPCCDKSKVKKGPWSPAEDLRLVTFIHKHGHGNWRALPKQAGLLRCGKSCRLRWINYLRPDLKRGNFNPEEEETIIKLHQSLGNKWSKIASHLPGRTDNEIKNVWNTHLKKRILVMKDAKNPHGEETKESSSFMSCDKQKAQGSLELCDMGVLEKEHQVPPMTDTDELKEASSSSPSSISLESDIDFWNMLDNLDSNFQSNEAQPSRSSSFGEECDREIECRKWLRQLENELGLEATSEGDHNNSPMRMNVAAGQFVSDQYSKAEGMAMWPSSSPHNFGI